MSSPPSFSPPGPCSCAGATLGGVSVSHSCRPGEYLYVKEIHYNQHGLLLLQGQGIYRLADSWYPVQAGDAIWMAPYVLQWYGALGTQTSRYILCKHCLMLWLAPAAAASVQRLTTWLLLQIRM